MAQNDIDRINRELDRARAKDGCLACGGTDTIIDTSANVAVPTVVDGTLDLGRAVEAVAIICTNCGFVRMHSTLHLFDEG